MYISKIKSNINAIIGYLYSLHDVVNCLGEKGENDLTNPKLQRLLYFIQGHSLMTLKKPAFTENIIAYQNGPVVEEVYHIFKMFVNHPIVLPNGHFNYNNLDNDIKSIIDFVFQEYAIYSPWYLRKVIASETPFAQTKEDAIISHESLQVFFTNKYD